MKFLYYFLALLNLLLVLASISFWVAPSRPVSLGDYFILLVSLPFFTIFIVLLSLRMMNMIKTPSLGYCRLYLSISCLFVILGLLYGNYQSFGSFGDAYFPAQASAMLVPPFGLLLSTLGLHLTQKLNTTVKDN